MEHRMTMSSGNELSFAKDIKPLFRQKDRDSMQKAFDLWDHDDVADNAEAILARPHSGDIPCDGAWPAAQVDTFRRWFKGGTPD
jgi:hypothetical protein